MFGLFKKSPDAETVATFQELCSQATRFIAGTLVNGKLRWADFEIDLDSPGTRENLRAGLLRYREQLSTNRDHWARDLQRLSAGMKGLYDDGNAHDIAAFHLLTGILQINTICKMALEHPRHRDFTRAAFNVLSVNGPALEQILDDRWQERHPLEPAVMPELRVEFPAIGKLMDKVIGWED